MIRKETRHGPNLLVRSAVLMLMTATACANQSSIGEGHEEQQGTRLHGTTLELFERTPIPLTNATLGETKLQNVVIDRGQLKSGVPELKGTQFSGVHFTTMVENEPVTFYIVEARQHRNVYVVAPDSPKSLSTTVWEYQVTWESPKLGSGELCPSGWALALPGRWNGELYSYDTSFFSFACVPQRLQDDSVEKGGVAAKCVDWGYPPWVNEDPRLDDTSLSLTTGDAVRHHLACTAMATADFCGEARPNTLEGTPITMFHLGNVQTEVIDDSPPVVAGGPVRQGFYFEAAWAVVDASTGQPLSSLLEFPAARVRAQALCLTKKRWATLPPNGSCSIQGPLKDPRTWTESSKPAPSHYRYCEEYTLDELKQEGAVLFSYSWFLDAGLYRFKRNNAETQNTDQFLSTAQIVIVPQQPYGYRYLPDPDVFKHWDDYVLDTSIPLGFEGPLFKFDAPATVLDGLPTRRLLRYRQKGGTGRFLTLVEGTPVPEDHELDQDGLDQGVEGHVHDSLAPANDYPRPLYLYGNGSDYLTSTSDNVPNFVPLLAQPMGYMPSLADYAAAEP